MSDPDLAQRLSELDGVEFEPVDVIAEGGFLVSRDVHTNWRAVKDAADDHDHEYFPIDRLSSHLLPEE
jgi:hypothetical protein